MFAFRRNPNRYLAVLLSFLLAIPTLQIAKAGDRDRDFCDRSMAKPDAGIPACTRLLDYNGKEENIPGVYNSRGVGNLVKGNLKSAIDDFTNALNREPNFFNALMNRGIAYHILKKYDDAIADFNRALELDGKAVATYNARGTALFQKGEYDSAIADYKKAIELKSDYTNAYINRGQAYILKREFDKAIADFDAAVRQDPNNLLGYINRGDARVSKGDFIGAIKDYDAVIGLDPKNSEAYTHRGEARRLHGDLEASLADHNKAIALNAKAKEAYTNRALTLKDLGKFDEAAESCNRAILIDPNYPAAFSVRGLIRRLSNHLKDSENDLDKAVALDSQFPLALSFRGDTRRELGNTDGALTDFNDAIGFWPEFVPAYTGRGLTYEMKGDFAKAKADFEKALSFSPAPDGLAKPAQEVARVHLGGLAAKEKARQEPNGDAVKADHEAIEKLKEEAAKKIKEADDRANKVAQAAKEDLQRYIDQQKAKSLDEAIPDPGPRVALVIGNSSYWHVDLLPNPQRDAKAVAEAFQKLGFKTILALNVTLDQFRDTLDKFKKAADQANWAVIYYAGHGLEVGGENYLVPVDARLRTDMDVSYEAVSLAHLRGVTEGAKKLHVVILDACRDNPFVSRMQKTMASRSIGRGFARVEEPEGGTLIAYSATEGHVAADGDGEHSPYTEAFLKNVVDPRLEIDMLFRRVHDDVMTTTQNRQEPHIYGSLTGEFFHFATK
jgi:tetratricopeptide (TPR) repeat protein